MNPIEQLIHHLRNSHPDMEYIFRNGSCYELFKILRTHYPKAECWYDQLEGHVYTKIGKVWYDIRGKHVKVSKACLPMEHQRGHKPHRWSKNWKYRNGATRLEDGKGEAVSVADWEVRPSPTDLYIVEAEQSELPR